MRGVFLVGVAILTVLLVSKVRADGPSTEHFEKKVRPLLAAHCSRCHGPEKPKGGLRLDSLAGMKAGGETGPIVVAGKPDESLLIEAVRYAGDLKMPPKGRLAGDEIAALVDWVRAGAPWPGPESSTKAANPTFASPSPGEEPKAFWAFQPVRDPVPPPVKNPAWVESPIDRFILAGLEANHLSPAPPVDKRILIRRVTFDLTGLPPTPGEVAGFLSDGTPDAFARLVDRLLASPRYGERWGRFWLDLARYADSNGMDENVAYAPAWRYRDYVIAAFNEDKPYDRFLKEQIAGDLLPSADGPAAHSRITATGFLVLGPKMLAEDDPMKMEMDIIDEQVDTVSKVFMGLTLGCARCHDHKFDPLPTADYYSLAGIFKSTKSMQNHSVVAMWNERALGDPKQTAALAAHREAVAAKTAEVKKVGDEARAALKRELRSHVADYLLTTGLMERAEGFRRSILAGTGGDKTTGLLLREAESFQRGNVGVDREFYGPGIGVILNVGPLPNFAEYDFEVPTAGVFQVELRYAAADPRPVRVKLNGEDLGSDVAGMLTGSWGPDSQRWTVAGLGSLKPGKTTLRIERAGGPIPHFDKVALVPRTLPADVNLADLKSSESLALNRGLNPKILERWTSVLARAKANPNSVFRPWIELAGRSFAVPGDPAGAIRARLGLDPGPKELAARYQRLFDEAAGAGPDVAGADPALAAFRKVIDDPDGPLSVAKQADAYFPADVRSRLVALREDLKAIQAKAPPVAVAMAVEDQKKPTNLKVHIRGSHLTLGEEVPRRFPRIVAAKDQTPIGDDRSGRLELAEWLTRSDHPLTSRVMANRLWLWHFGQGIVRSPDNFGRLGERPTHPELLDWLARRFVESGWSMKAMHRLILRSATYQMSTRHNEAASVADPENRLRWRFDRRRLEAEAIRDSMLAVSGLLDTTMGGSRLAVKTHDYVNSTGASQKSALYDVNLRSVYLPVIRSGLYPVFQAFDFADPSSSSGQRVPTTVAPQALFMMNDPLALRTSADWAERLRARTDLNDAGRVRLAYENAYGRAASDEECARALEYLSRFDALLTSKGVKDADRPARKWQAMAQSILAASEFISIE